MSACAFCSAPAQARGNGRPDLCPACLDRLADLGSAALDALGQPARGWRARVYARSVRAGGIDTTVYVGVLLRKARQ